MTAVIIDSHILIWWLLDSPELKPNIKAFLTNPAQKVYVSVATVWEIAIKQAMGKLQGFENLPDMLAISDFEVIDIKPHHAMYAANLPLHHKDPFDRMIIAQSILEKLTLISEDRVFSSYSMCLLMKI
jgi:PIN domain nuclease of toxin-antitoxin system